MKRPRNTKEKSYAILRTKMMFRAVGKPEGKVLVALAAAW
jgi:hypothetical protein